MAERVRIECAARVRVLLGVAFDDVPEHLACERLARPGYEGVRAAAFAQEHGTDGVEIVLQAGQRLTAERNEAFLVAFAAHAHEAGFAVDLRDLQLHQFGDAQAGRVQDFQHGPVAHSERGVVFRRGEQGLHPLAGGHARQGPAELRQAQQCGRVGAAKLVFALQKTVQAAQRGQHARLAAPGHALLVQTPQKADHVHRLRVAQIVDVLVGQVSVKAVQVAAVHLDRARRQSLLYGQIDQVRVQQRIPGHGFRWIPAFAGMTRKGSGEGRGLARRFRFAPHAASSALRRRADNASVTRSGSATFAPAESVT